MLFNMSFGLPGPQPQDTVDIEHSTIYVDPEPHTIPAADLALINRTEGATGFYTPSVEVIPLELEPGVVVNFDNNTSGLEKRDGWREFTAYKSSGCYQPNEIFVANNFGCGVCVSWSGCLCDGAGSVRLRQEWDGSPYPTASVFDNEGCSGSYQSVGIIGTNSCTNSNSGAKYSAFLYWGC